MISHEDVIPTRLVERHDVDALIIVPLDGGGSVTVADGEVHGDFLLDPIASPRDSASILNDTPPLSCRSLPLSPLQELQCESQNRTCC